MTLTKDITAKFAVAAVAVAMIFSAYAPAAQAQTTEDLQQMINDLLEQVAQLQMQAGGDVSAPAGAPTVCPYTWTRDLTMGSEGADVMKLQQFLNSYPDLRVGVTGAGSAGMETMFFGPATAAAVSKMQVMFRAEVLTPNGLVNPTGYFGPSSRSKANDLCVADATPVEVDEAEEGAEEEAEEEMDMTLGGEASLDNFELEDGESTIEEGDEDVEIGEITVEFTNGDAEISRIDVTLQASGADAWDAFDTISLWVDGDMIAEMDASDEDDYLDEDTGELRFSNLGLIAMEDEEMTIIVGASVQNNLDADELTDWNLEVSSMRFFDADGVATTEADPANTDVSSFEIEEAGENEELNISLSSSNPDSADIIVDVDSDTDDVTIMVADIEAEDNDIELNKIVVLVDTGAASTTKVVDDIRLVIDGESFDAESILGTAVVAPTTMNSRFANVSGTAVWYVFDIDGDIVIDEDDEQAMEVVVDFNDTDEVPNLNYANGTIISATVGSTELLYWEAEGADDLEHGVGADPQQFSGTANGEDHLLVAEGIVLPLDGVETSTDTQGDNDQTGIFTIEFEVTAVEDDFYITDLVTASTSAVEGIAYRLGGPSGFVATTSGVLSSTADEDTEGVFTVNEGETETFTMTVTVDTDTTGQHRVTLTEVNFSANVNGTSDIEVYIPTPAQDFRTSFRNINAN